MNVALFSSSIEPRDGYGNIAFELTHALVKAGVECTMFLPNNLQNVLEKLSLPCATRCVLPPYVFRIYQPAGLRYFLPVDVSAFDLVHSLFSFPYCLSGAVSAKRYRKPFLMGAQGTHGVRPLTYLPERWLLKKSYRQAAAIAVPSIYTRDKITEYAKENYPIHVIHNGVHFDRFQKDVDINAVRRRHPGKKILLTVGGLWGRKGHDFVIKALPQILRNAPDTVYMIVGEGNARSDLERLAEEMGVRAAVDFTGRLSGDDLVAAFQACDIYVHTPKVVDLKFEGFGIVYLEASACGKPIVATDAGGIRDAVLDEETGLIAPDGDINGIANRILRLLKDDTLASTLGKAGYRYAQAHDWPHIAQQFLALYRHTLS